MISRNFWKHWANDEDGSLTIEFVLWTPFIMMWFVVSVVLFDAHKSRNRAAQAIHTLSDIMSRQVEVTDPFFDNLALLQANLVPRAPAGVQLRISSIEFRNGSHNVQWSWSSNGISPLTDNTINLADVPNMADLETIVLTETSVPYMPFVDWLGLSARRWEMAIATRPRFVSHVAKTDQAPSS